MDTTGHGLDGFRADTSKSVWDNWRSWIAKQEGGLSNWEGDTASASYPPEKHTDGQYYHTNRGWTWPTWKSVRTEFGLSVSSRLFYTMTEKDSARLMFLKYKKYFKPLYKDEVISVFAFYIWWGGGWYTRWNSFFTAYRKTSFKDALKKDQPLKLFKAMVKSRAADLAFVAKTSYSKYPNIKTLWLGAIQIFYREFKKLIGKGSGSGALIPVLFGLGIVAAILLNKNNKVNERYSANVGNWY